MEFRILGRLEVLDHGQELALGGARQRAVLALLLVHRREVVPIDRLVDELWGERPPATAKQTVRVYISRLRKTLGDGVLETHGRGYRLAVPQDQIDAERFDAMVADGRAALRLGDAEAAVGLLVGALALWQAPALEEFAYETFAQAEIARLQEARLAALEDRLDAELQAGRGPELVAELENLVTQHPLRERFVAELMLALYRAGRQADALASYRSARQRLVQELGLEPGPALRELERRILDHDPALVPAGAAVRAPRSRRSRALLLAAASALGVVAALAVVFGIGSAHSTPPTIGGSNGIVAISAASGGLVRATRLSGTPGAVSVGSGSVWVADPSAGDVSQVDPVSGVVTDRVPVAGGPGSAVSGGGAIWVASTDAATVTRINPATGTVTQTIALPGEHLSAVAYGRGRLWVADSVANELFEITAATGALRRTVSLDFAPSAIATEGGSLWVAGYGDATVEKLNPMTGRAIARVRVGDGPTAISFAAGSLWVANSLDSTVSRIEPTSLKVTATIPVGSGPSALTVADGTVWVANQYADTVSRIDPGADRVVDTVRIPGDPTSLAVSDKRVWAGVAANSRSHRGGTLVIVTPGLLSSSQPSTPASVDPAFYDSASNPQFDGLAYDSLVNLEQSPGTDGLRLVPDLALSIPTPGDGGRTYAFRIRPGIRYSNGMYVRADDFRRGFERMFRLRSPGVSLFEDIVGARACVRDRYTCDLSRGVVTNDTAGTVTFHLSGADPDFIYKLTESSFSAPIPPGTPDHETGQHTVPGTGPYMFASVSETKVRFVRNPYFHEWSHAAQPNGHPNAIVWKSVAGARAAVSAIEHGQADWLFGQIPEGQYRQLRLQAPGQLHSNPAFAVDFAPLNTHRAPFNNALVRQALNYAINRATIVRLYGGPRFATPDCQVIAPGLPGYRRYCPYTLHPSTDGVWSAPDMQRARQLVMRSGTTGERVDVSGDDDEGFVPASVPAYVAWVLRALGYRVHLHLLPSSQITEAMRERFQLSVDGDWLAAYPYPSSYVPAFFSCGGSNTNGYYCNPSLDREMREAEMLELRNPPKAGVVWARIDRQLTDAAVWVPTVTVRDVELTSSRLRNYQYNPVWGFLADQAWVR